MFIVLGFVFRILAGIALALNNTAGYSILSSDYKDKYSKVVGLMEMFTGLGIIVGPIVTAALYTVIGAFWSFMTMATIIFSTAVPAFFMLGKERPYNKATAVEDREIPALLKDPVRTRQVIWADLLSLVIAMTGIGFFDLMLTSYLVSMGASTEIAAVIYIISCITYAITSPLVSYFPESLDKRLLIFLGIFITFLCNYISGSLPPFPTNIWIVAIGAGLEGIGVAFVIGEDYSVAVYPHMLHHCTNVMMIPHDDLLSDKISSKSYGRLRGCCKWDRYGRRAVAQWVIGRDRQLRAEFVDPCWCVLAVHASLPSVDPVLDEFDMLQIQDLSHQAKFTTKHIWKLSEVCSTGNPRKLA